MKNGQSCKNGRETEEGADNQMETHCRHCNQELKNGVTRQEKKYCNDACRMAYWKNHPEEINRKAYYNTICKNCGQTFESYGNAGRMYCSRACYYEMRYVKKGLIDTPGWQDQEVEIRALQPLTENPGSESVGNVPALPSITENIIDAYELPNLRRIWLICGATPFSGKINHFAARVPPELNSRLIEGDAFVFCSSQRDLLSLLRWEKDGFALYYKRLEHGKYPWPKAQGNAMIVEISPKDFAMLLAFPDFIIRCEQGAFRPLESVRKPVDEILF